jgi:1,4-dihydroxy-2-naphthoyl-CoA hydrolase
VAERTADLDAIGNWDEINGLRYDVWTAERVVAHLDAGPRHHQPYGIVHGGVYASMVESVASHGAAAVAERDGRAGVVGVSNTTDFLRSHSTGPLTATGTPIHIGRSQQVWEVAITRDVDGKLVAHGQVRLHVLDALPADRA